MTISEELEAMANAIVPPCGNTDVHRMHRYHTGRVWSLCTGTRSDKTVWTPVYGWDQPKK